VEVRRPNASGERDGSEGDSRVFIKNKDGDDWTIYRSASWWERLCSFCRVPGCKEVIILHGVELYPVEIAHKHQPDSQKKAIHFQRPHVMEVSQRVRPARCGLWGFLFDLKHSALVIRMSNGKEVVLDKNADTGVLVRRQAVWESFLETDRYCGIEHFSANHENDSDEPSQRTSVHQEATSVVIDADLLKGESVLECPQMKITKKVTNKGHTLSPLCSFEELWSDIVVQVPSFVESMERSNCQHFCHEVLKELYDRQWINAKYLCDDVSSFWTSKRSTVPLADDLFTNDKGDKKLANDLLSLVCESLRNRFFSGGLGVANLFDGRALFQHISRHLIRYPMSNDDSTQMDQRLVKDGWEPLSFTAPTSYQAYHEIFPFPNQAVANVMQRHHYLDEDFKFPIVAAPSFGWKLTSGFFCKARIGLFFQTWMKSFALVKDETLFKIFIVDFCVPSENVVRAFSNVFWQLRILLLRRSFCFDNCKNCF